MARESVIPEQTVREDIRAVEEYPGMLVRVMTGLVDGDGVFLVPQQFSTYEIKDADLAELMSESPSWAPGKPADTYRNEDLWVFIDRIRNRK